MSWGPGYGQDDSQRELIRLRKENDELKLKFAEAKAALEPFAKFACDEPCQCHNCVARATLRGLP